MAAVPSSPPGVRCKINRITSKNEEKFAVTSNGVKTDGQDECTNRLADGRLRVREYVPIF